MSQTKLGSSVTRRLGDKLVVAGLLSEDQLDRAIAEQGSSSASLIAVILKLGFLDEEPLIRFLSQLYSIPYVRLTQRDIDPETLRLVPPALAKTYDLLPIKREGATLTLAMADPTNVFAVDTVAFMTDLQIIRVIASQSAIREAIERSYGAPPPVIAEPLDATPVAAPPPAPAVAAPPVSAPPPSATPATRARPAQPGGRRLGDLLVAQGFVTEEQLAKALAEQKGTAEKLGSVLLRLNFIQEEELTRFLSRQYGVPAITLSQMDIDPEVLRLVPPQMAKKYEVLPIKREESTLTLAMADPTNVAALDDVAFLTNLQVSPVVAPQAAIRQAIDRNYEAQAAAIGEVLAALSSEMTDVEVVDEEGETRVSVFELKESADEAPVVRLVNMVLVDAIRKGASDIHWEAYEKVFRIRFRIDGVLHEMLAPPKRLEAAIISRLKIMANLDIAERRMPQDGRIKLRYNSREIDFRVSMLPTIFGEKAVLRILDKDALKLDLTQLGFDVADLERFNHAIHQPYGMVLITGPTGSGKTTTLYSAIHTINKPDHNIMTAEDPVEYNLKGVNQVQIDDGVGRTFAAALRSFLRQDPDVILVGETRDLETAQISIRAALTGHLVFSTLHTNDSPSTIARLVDMGIPPFLIASALVLIVAQRLGRKVCEACKVPYEADEESLVPYGHLPTGAGTRQLYKGKGCQTCNFTGMKGRIAIYEVMPVTPELRDAVLKAAPTAELHRIAQAQGMRTLRQAGLQKVIDGVTTVDEVLRVTMS